MTLFNDVSHARLLARYRFLFRASTMAFGAAVFYMALGVLALIFAWQADLLLSGVLLAAVSGLLGYKIAVSTMRLLDAQDETVWQQYRN